MSDVQRGSRRQASSPPGFYGKLPSRGDFVARRIPPDLLTGWTAWLDAGLADSRSTLGEAWQATYLSSPIWRFAAAARCCGDQAFAGILMPSVDRVGRYYPLSILAPLGGEWSAVEVALAAPVWFEQMETLTLACLADDLDLAAFDAAVAAAPFPRADAAMPPASPAAAVPRLLDDLFEQNAIPYSLWWRTASPSAEPRFLAFCGLPPRATFATLLG